MKAILLKEFGGPEQLYLGEAKKPTPSSNEVLVKVKTTALNRADTLQRMGKYPPPPGASLIIGLEMAGVIEAVGIEVTDWKVGDRVCALLAGGGYAEFVTIHSQCLIPIPEGFDFEKATAIPEVFLTAYQAIFYLSKFKKGERILIHAGASGVGTAAIQLAKSLGAREIIVTASAGKHQICKDLGADFTIDYKTQNFEEEVSKITNGEGVDVIIDFLAAPYFQKNINSLNFDGRMVMLALMGGWKVEELILANILRKRLHIMGSTLRARTLDYKIGLTKDFSDYALAKFTTGELKPVIDSIFDWKEVADAHRLMESNGNSGKIVLRVE
ncbi:MAG: NAD(P)H-quinone oxidoreductase [Saprospiraceae bacterium]